MKPIVAVVGRPNVGKSTLVNRLAQTSDAIVHESRGVTRDRSYHTADWNGREFTIVDTGGIEPLKSDDVFATSIRDQALAAAEEAAVILFVVDGRTGVTEEDESVARMLKRCDKPVFLLVNKLDNPDRHVIILDHCVPAASEKYAQNHKDVRDFVAKREEVLPEGVA